MPYWRLSSFYFFYFALLGAIIPFWPLYLSDQGYGPLEIGMLGAIIMGTKVLSPYLLGWLADKTGRPLRIIRYAAFLSLFCFMGIFISLQGFDISPFAWLIIVVGSFSFFWNAVIGQFESVTLNNLGDDFESYGKIRAWGSIGFIAAVILLGWVFDFLKISQLPVFMAVLLLCIWLSSLCVKERQVTQAHEQTQGLLPILKSPSVIAFFTVCFLLQLSHGPYYTFYSIYLSDMAYSKLLIGLLWGGAVLAEMLMFLTMGKLLRRFSVRAIFMMSLLSCSLRWLIIGLFPNSLTLLIAAQIMHAFTFASFHAVAVEWVRQAFKHGHQGQGQALYSAVSFGAGGSVGAIISGILWHSSPLAVWLIAALAGFAGFIIVWRYIPRTSTSAG